MSARRVTDAMLFSALRLLGPRFTARELKAALAHTGVTGFTQARYWLLYHTAQQSALIRVRERVTSIGKAGRPTIVYEVTTFGQQRIAAWARGRVPTGE